MITQKQVKKLFKYEPTSGLFIRRSNQKIYTPGVNNYVSIVINGCHFSGAQLAVIYMVGNKPARVSHIDFDSTNDRWDNLEYYFRKRKTTIKSFTKKQIHYVVRYLYYSKQYRVFRIVRDKLDLLGDYDNQDIAINVAFVENYKLYKCIDTPKFIM